MNETQQQEIAKLRPGVAAVYQNGWADAVLCKIDYFDKSRERPFLFTPDSMEIDHPGLIGQAIAELLSRRVPDGKSSRDSGKVDAFIKYDSSLLTVEEREAQRFLSKRIRDKHSTLTSDEEYRTLCHLLPLEQLLKGGVTARDISQWVNYVEKSILHQAQLTQDEMNSLISLCLYRWSRKEVRAKNLYVRYLEHVSTSGKE